MHYKDMLVKAFDLGLIPRFKQRKVKHVARILGFPVITTKTSLEYFLRQELNKKYKDRLYNIQPPSFEEVEELHKRWKYNHLLVRTEDIKKQLKGERND